MVVSKGTVKSWSSTTPSWVEKRKVYLGKFKIAIATSCGRVQRLAKSFWENPKLLWLPLREGKRSKRIEKASPVGKEE